MRRCRDCKTMIGNKFILCEPCRLKASEQQKKKKAVRAKKYRTKEHIKTILPPHKCQTCDNIVNGKATFCMDCRMQRNRDSRKKYEKNKPLNKATNNAIGYIDDIPVWDYSWMEKFKPWMESGLPYSEYQRRERENRL